MDCSLLVQTCDNYLAFWKGMAFSLDLTWDFKSIPVYWASEELSLIDAGLECRGIEYNPIHFRQILTGKTDKHGFSTRMRIALEQLDTKWVIYIQEDMWPLSKIDNSTLEKLLLFAEAKQADSIKIHTKLHYYESYILEPTEFVIDGIRMMRYSQGNNFLHSHNATIWNREYLLKHLRDGEDPWSNELQGSIRMSIEKHNHYHYNMYWYAQPGVCDFGKGNADYYRLGPILDDRMELKLKWI